MARHTRRPKSKSKAKAKAKAKPAPARPAAGRGLTFNHAMVYCTDLARSLAFYRDALGMRVVDEHPGAYARLVCPGSDSTIGLHVLDPGMQLDTAREGMRLYYEVPDLAKFCAGLAAAGIVFDQMPERMPWGWEHAYLKDPDGHEVSLYRAGKARLQRTRMSGDS